MSRRHIVVSVACVVLSVAIVVEAVGNVRRDRRQVVYEDSPQGTPKIQMSHAIPRVVPYAPPSLSPVVGYPGDLSSFLKPTLSTTPQPVSRSVPSSPSSQPRKSQAKERKISSSQPKSRDSSKAEASSEHTAVTSGSYVPVFVPKHLVHRLHSRGASVFSSLQEAHNTQEYNKASDAPKRLYSYASQDHTPLPKLHSPSYQHAASPYEDSEKGVYSHPPPASYRSRPGADSQQEYRPVRLADTGHLSSTNHHYDSPRYHATADEHSQEVDDYNGHSSPNRSKERYTSRGHVAYAHPDDASHYHGEPADENSGEAYDAHGGRDSDNRQHDYHYVPKAQHSSTYGSSSLYNAKQHPPERHEVGQPVYGKLHAEGIPHQGLPLKNNEAFVPSLHSSYPVRGETSDKLNTRSYSQYEPHVRLVPLEPERLPQQYDSIAEGNPYVSGKTYTAVTTAPKYSHDITYPSTDTIRFNNLYTKSQLLPDSSQNKHGDSNKSYYGVSLTNSIGGRYLSSSLFDRGNTEAFSQGDSAEPTTTGYRTYYKSPVQSSYHPTLLDTRLSESLKSEYGSGAQIAGSTSLDKIKPYTHSDLLGSNFQSFAKSFLPSSLSPTSFDDGKYGHFEGSTTDHSTLTLTTRMPLDSSYSFGLDDYTTSASKHVTSTDDTSSSTGAMRRISKDRHTKGRSASLSRAKRHVSEVTKCKSKVDSTASSENPTPLETAAASRFLPMSQPFGSSQEFGYNPFFNGQGGSSPSFSSTFGYAERSGGKTGPFDGISFGRSSPAFHHSEEYGYDQLGSGNFEVIRGGVYSNEHAGSSQVPYYMQSPGSFNSGTYGYEETEPILGFQGFEHFGNPLHNALSKQAQIVGSPSEKKEHTDEAHSDHLESASRLIEINNDLEASE